MTRWLLTTLALACHIALSSTGHAQPPAGPPAYSPGAFGPDGFPIAPELIPSPRDRGFLYDTDSQLDLDLRETLERSWIRLEYLNWDVTKPSPVTLGAPMLSNDPAGPFPVVDPFGFRPSTLGFVPNLAGFDFPHNNGIRGTVGISLRPFTFEGSAWYLGQGRDSLHIDPVEPTPLDPFFTIPVISLFNNGALSNQVMIPFGTSFDASIGINMFGADTNLLLNPMQPGNPIQVQPLVGLKYIQYKNDLRISGSDITLGTSPSISSVAENNNFGPQVGLRFSYDTKWVSFSADPKFAFGINRHIDSLSSSQLFSPTELDRTLQEEKTSFAPIFDLGVNARIHMSQHLSVFVSYNFLAIGRQSTSWENIYYNAPPNPLTDPSALGLNITKKSVIAHGITVGGELRFR